jgi:hypothetical protein
MVLAIWMLVLPSIGWAAELSGTVLEDSSDKPLDASLILYKKNAQGGWDFTGSEDTDKNGKYVFSNLEAGTYYLECEAFDECDPQVYYCADKYLPQIYNKAAPWDFKHKKEIVLKKGDVKTLETIVMKFRPFFFDTVPKTDNTLVIPGAGDTVTISGKVVNKTGNWVWMMFWAVVDSPNRTDHSLFYDMSASFPLEKQLVLLEPGTNTVAFTLDLSAAAAEGKYYYSVYGGTTFELPKMPAFEGSFEKKASGKGAGGDESFEENGISKGDSHCRTKAVPTRLSAEGKVLERGLLPR